MRRFVTSLIIIGLAWPLWAASAARASLAPQATIITVNTSTDENNGDGDCSLREAIRAANLNAPVDACPAGTGADTIIVPAGIYSLTLTGSGEGLNLTGDLNVTTPMTIQGAGAALTTIDGLAQDRVLDVQENGAVLVLSGVTIQNGKLVSSAGGLYVGGGATLTLTNAVLTNNMAGISGGGLASAGTVYLQHVTFISNSAQLGAAMSLASTSGTANIQDTVVLSGTGESSVYVVQPGVSFSNTLIANSSGAGLELDYGAAVTLSQVTLRDNLDSGIQISDANSRLTVFASAIISNSSNLRGGGILADSPFTLTNVTVANNGAQFGAGLAAFAGADLTNVTIANNDIFGVGAGGGISGTAGSPVVLRNTIIANNDGQNCFAGTVVDAGNNLRFGDTSCPGSINLADPQLGVLQAVGATYVLPLAEGSPAVGAANPTLCPSTDQRGRLRDDHCDIGAYEYLPPPLTFVPMVFRYYVHLFPGPFEQEPNDQPAQANGALQSGVNYQGYQDDDSDYFSFYLAQAGHIHLTLSNPAAEHMQLQLRQPSGNGTLLIDYDFSPDYLINFNGASGWYLARVFTESGFNSSSPYTLQVTFP